MKKRIKQIWVKENLILVLLGLFVWIAVSLETKQWSIGTLIVCLFSICVVDLVGAKLLGHSLHKSLTDKDWE